VLSLTEPSGLIADGTKRVETDDDLVVSDRLNSGRRRVHNQQAARAMVRHFVGHATQDEAPHPRHPAVADDNQVRANLLGDSDEEIRCVTGSRVRLDRYAFVAYLVGCARANELACGRNARVDFFEILCPSWEARGHRRVTG